MLLYKKGENPCEFSPLCMRSLVATLCRDEHLIAIKKRAVQTNVSP